MRPSLAIIVGFIVITPALAQIERRNAGSGFSNPVFATSAPGTPGTLYVVQQGGQIRALNPATGTIGGTMLTLGAGNGFVGGGERGLLGLAFHPNFQSNGLIYVQYTYNNGSPNHGLRVEQYQVTNGVADQGSRRTVIEYSHPDNSNHNAGWLGFNPTNGTTGGNSGHLYVMTGDGGGSNDPQNNAQNRNSLLGKTLRLDVGNGLTAGNPNYGIPTGNMTGANTRAELFSYGLRNPYRASFDRTTGNLYIGDVGQSAREEVDFIANGATGGQNFGWRLREGTIQTPGSVGGNRPSDNVEPIHEYDHSVGQSITGGYVYRGIARDDNGVALDGAYFYADYVQGRIWSFKYNGSSVTEFTERTAELGFTSPRPNFSSFAEDGFGNLYVIDYSGTIWEIVPVPEPATILGGIGLMALGVTAVRRWRATARRK